MCLLLATRTFYGIEDSIRYRFLTSQLSILTEVKLLLLYQTISWWVQTTLVDGGQLLPSLNNIVLKFYYINQK